MPATERKLSFERNLNQMNKTYIFIKIYICFFRAGMLKRQMENQRHRAEKCKEGQA